MTAPSLITCEETLRRLDDYLDRSLSAVELAELEAHLAVCDACSREYRFESRVVEEIKVKLRRVEVPGDLAARIAARLGEAE